MTVAAPELGKYGKMDIRGGRALHVLDVEEFWLHGQYINHLLYTAMKTLNLKYFGVTILIFRGHVTSSERDHRTRREHFSIGGQ